jgi:hypothetical protein
MQQIPLSYIKDLDEGLSEVSAFFGRKEPTERSARVWARKLYPTPIAAVRAALDDWMGSGRVMPVPEDIAGRAREIHARELREREQRQRSTEVEALGPINHAQLARVSAFLSSFSATRITDPLAWAHRLQQREAAGERLSTAQRQNWRAALRVRSAVVMETEAEREARAEREAMQAEELPV